jgi:hypothetical protein
MKVSDLTSARLLDQVQKGRKWLHDNAQKTGTDNNEVGGLYDDVDFQKKLALYEAMVDECRFRGLSEEKLQTDEELIENEKKIKLQTANTDTHNRDYAQLHSKWWKLREEGLSRGLFKFFIPSSLDVGFDNDKRGA